MTTTKDSLYQAIRDIINNVINDVATAKSLFEALVKQCDDEVRPLLLTGNTNHSRILNGILAELRQLIKDKFPDVISAAPDKAAKILEEIKEAGPAVAAEIDAIIHK